MAMELSNVTKGIQPSVSEYPILWEALEHYEEKLEKCLLCRPMKING